MARLPAGHSSESIFHLVVTLGYFDIVSLFSQRLKDYYVELFSKLDHVLKPVPKRNAGE